MPIFKLSESLSVAAQITPQDVPNIAAQGFTTVVCNRPDGEVPDQASMDEIEAACNAAGLLFVRYPVNAMNFPGADLDGLGELFDDPSQSVLAYCRTGTRCANLWVATRSDEDTPEAIKVARDIGFDLSMVVR
ncbi:MAG: TIGR01244 family sulfur transferase [Halieaceae bacterium]|jgi:sulfide:quinone oxidoreductase